MDRVATRSLALHRGLPALLGWVLGWHGVRDADVFWHLTLGRAVLRHHSRVVPEPIAHVAFSDPCVVKEWLWDVLCYALYALGGIQAVAWLMSVFGAAVGYRAARLVELRQAGPLRPIHTLVAVLAVCGVAEALDGRPNLVFFALLLACLELSLRYVAAAPQATRVAYGLGLVLVQVGWAQLHASYPLGPVLFGLALLEARVLGVCGRSRTRTPSDAPVLLGLLLAMLTSAHGLSALTLVLNHAGGDATAHIQDMRSTDWSQLSLSPHAPLLIAAIVALCIAGVCVAGKPAWFGVSFAVLGALMAINNARFLAVWPLLCLPWAGTALSVLSTIPAPAQRRVQLLYAAVTACVLGLAAQRVDATFGPMFRRTLRPGDHPEAAARYLGRLARGSAVFTEFTVGPPLGFWLDGRVRTFVDGRTPMYFDDTDWALARDMLAFPSAWQRAVARYGFSAAVVSRESSLCPALAASWTPVVVEAGFTTFVPLSSAAASAVQGIAPCGPVHLDPAACDAEGRALFATLATQARLMPSPFLQLIEVAAELQCRGRASDLRALPAQAESRAFLPVYRLYSAWALLAAGQQAAALAVVRDGLSHDDPLAARVLLFPIAGEVPVEQARALLAQAVKQMDDNAPPAMRARLALLCQAEGDAECARFQGLRALLNGEQSARPALQWAAEHHASARVRHDLRAWLALPP